ncbi:hypothetical protein HYFRA_00011350 [Hymenoscyphus fraxineus]|uniref:Uncharacterized protein n=1 Tax=Hymenoscyphus fraxineus TaxID=746836 RepID=A0A9N9KYG5_9HELO|nr:hypothetical protein HYFRA_00011350 [Hymenoscyphus fraxineus]
MSLITKEYICKRRPDRRLLALSKLWTRAIAARSPHIGAMPASVKWEGSQGPSGSHVDHLQIKLGDSGSSGCRNLSQPSEGVKPLPQLCRPSRLSTGPVNEAISRCIYV